MPAFRPGAGCEVAGTCEPGRDQVALQHAELFHLKVQRSGLEFLTKKSCPWPHWY